MSLNVSALSTWNDEISAGLVKEILLKASTINGNLVTKMYGVKGDTVKLNSVSSSINATNTLCGWSNTGTTTLGQTTMSLCPIKFQESICIDTLQKYYTSWFTEAKYNTEQLPFEEVFFSNKTEYIAKELDRIAWRADNSAVAYVSGLTGNLTVCRGFLGTAYANSASTVNITKTAITIANAVTVVDSINSSVSSNVPQIIDNEGLTLFLSPADFASYKMSLRTLNLYNYTAGVTENEEILHPGSIALKVKNTNGLNGAASGTFICTPKANIVLGISDESDLNFKTFYSNDNDELRMNAKIKIGTGFYFPELVLRSA